MTVGTKIKLFKTYMVCFKTKKRQRWKQKTHELTGTNYIFKPKKY